MQSQHRPSIPQSFGELHLIKVDVAIHTNKDKATSIFGDIIFFPQFGGGGAKDRELGSQN
jgi:hypothetical protein